MSRYVEIQNSRGKVRFGKTRPYLLSILENAGHIKSNITTTRAIVQHGATPSRASYEVRPLLLKVGIAGIDKADTDRKFRELSRILVSDEDTTLIYKTYDKPYRIKGRIVAIDEAERVGKLKQIVIHIECYNPFWTDIEDLREDIALWEKTFEFPCYFDECVELGVRVDNLIVNVINNGDVESGMTIVFKCNGTVKNPQITNIDTQEKIKVNGEFTAGDRVVVYTQFGNVGVDLKRNNETKSILNLLDIDSTFIQLAIGDNVLRYGADEGLERLDVSIYHNNLYLGV